MTASVAHDVLTAKRSGPTRSVFGSCSGCAALVARDEVLEHERFHQALDVLAARLLEPSS